MSTLVLQQQIDKNLCCRQIYFERKQNMTFSFDLSRGRTKCILTGMKVAYNIYLTIV